MAIGLLTACSSSTDGDHRCAIGELRGTWKVTYDEKNGTCGEVADETVVLSEAASQQAQSSCVYRAQEVSADKCRLDLDFTCPLATGAGSQTWVGALRHTAEDTISGEMTAQFVLDGRTCRQ
jgi:hypothetical protein